MWKDEADYTLSQHREHEITNQHVEQHYVLYSRRVSEFEMLKEASAYQVADLVSDVMIIMHTAFPALEGVQDIS